jgi:hypothetical protein
MLPIHAQNEGNYKFGRNHLHPLLALDLLLKNKKAPPIRRGLDPIGLPEKTA